MPINTGTANLMDISFIIPVYNGAKTLGRALESVFTADPELREAIVIDDGSTDETAEICQAWQEKYGDQLIYIRQENQGVAVTRNRGLAAARGEWLWFLDCDDELAPDAVTALQDVVEQHQSPDVVIGAYKVYHGVVYHIQHPGVLAESRGARVIDFLIRKKLRPTHGAIVVNKRIIGSFSYCEAMRQSEDIPAFTRLLLDGRVVLTDHCLAIMHRCQESLRNNAAYAIENINLLVDEVFKIPRLPDEVTELRPKYMASRYVSASRIALRAGQKEAARKCFWRAVDVYPVSLLWLKSIRFLLRSYLPFSRNTSA